MAFSGASSELWALTHAQLQQLKADFNSAATPLIPQAGHAELEGAARGEDYRKRVPAHGLSEDDLATFGTLSSLLPALVQLVHSSPLANERAAGHEHGVQRLAEKLGAGALPALTCVTLHNTHVGDAGASALAAALDRGALPRLEYLSLTNAAIGDAGVVALAPGLRRLRALRFLRLSGNRSLGDVGAAALVAPPPPAGAGAPPTTTGALTAALPRGVARWHPDHGHRLRRPRRCAPQRRVAGTSIPVSLGHACERRIDCRPSLRYS